MVDPPAVHTVPFLLSFLPLPHTHSLLSPSFLAPLFLDLGFVAHQSIPGNTCRTIVWPSRRPSPRFLFPSLWSAYLYHITHSVCTAFLTHCLFISKKSSRQCLPPGNAFDHTLTAIDSPLALTVKVMVVSFLCHTRHVTGEVALIAEDANVTSLCHGGGRDVCMWWIERYLRRQLKARRLSSPSNWPWESSP